MVEAVESDLKQLVLSSSTFGPSQIGELTEAISHDYNNFRLLRDATAELEQEQSQSPASRVRLGVCYYLLGRFSQAVETLKKADGGGVAQFYLAKSYFALGEYDNAIQSYDAAAQAGYDRDLCVIGQSEALRYGEKPAEALARLDELSGPVEQTAEYLYQRGATVSALGENPLEAVALYERAVAQDDRHAGALFGLALENDRRGNDNVALDLYQKAANVFPTHVGTLVNLGIIYEDFQRYSLAEACYQRVLDVQPSHPRARMFSLDTQASSDMLYDEDAEKRRDRLHQIMGIPVTDFELSVRSRNCLQKMGIMTLGDLVECTEADLLASKNFGETSLMEIRDMLSSKGLSLGQVADRPSGGPEAAPYDYQSLSPDEQALLERPIAELNLSVRARKCMTRLGIATIGELVRRSGDDLLECKNFGVTSLNEVREKLTLHGLKLRGD